MLDLNVQLPKEQLRNIWITTSNRKEQKWVKNTDQQNYFLKCRVRIKIV